MKKPKLPDGYTCACGKRIKFNTYVIVNWHTKLVVVCGACGREATILRGVATVAGLPVNKATPLQPLIDLCRKRRGLKSWVLREMTKRNVPGNWANVSEWLHADPAKRRCPVPATLAGLLAIQQEVAK